MRRAAAVAILVLLAAGCVGTPTPPAAVAEDAPGESLRDAATDAPGNRSAPDRNATRGEPRTLPATPGPPPPPPASAPVASPHVVVALIDTGINPYHVEFRDDSALASAHPSTYIPGYPSDARALRLTLGASTLEDALEADADAWAAVEPGAVYWVPGTRVVGLVVTDADGTTPGFDDDGHGTMSASRAAGATTSLAPEARIVMIEGFGHEGVTWAADQPWIDLQSNSWVVLTPHPPTRDAFAAAAAKQLVLAASGNGVAQVYGGVGQPATLAATSGAPGVLAVGAHDNGRPTPWSGTVPHVVADGCWNWAAVGDSLDETGPRVGSGTSSAAPYVAGAAAALVLEARRVLGDLDGRDGATLAAGAPGVVADGPLADGDLTLEELKALVTRTAIPRPAATEHDGEVCDATTAPYATAPVPFEAAPGDVPAYYLVGYGAVNVHSLAAALAVLAGDAPLAERAEEDAWFATEASARGALP